MKQRLIKLIYRNTTGYGLDTVIHYINHAGVKLTLQPISYAEYLHKTSRTSPNLNSYYHDVNHYKIYLNHKGIEVVTFATVWQLSKHMAEAVHEFNHKYLDKHMDNPEEYPLCQN